MSAATLTIKINVDTSKVEYVSGPGNSNFVNGRVIYTWTDPNGGLSPITSGTVATFKFKAKSAGTASFSVSGEFYDSNEIWRFVRGQRGANPPCGEHNPSLQRQKARRRS